MRTTGFDKETIAGAMNNSLIVKIKAVSCPNCHKSATDVKVENGKLQFKACCETLRQTIIDKIRDGSL